MADHAHWSRIGCNVQSVSAVTWQRGGGGLAAGGAEEFDVRGMKPASLALLASSLEGKEPVRVNQSLAGSLLNSASQDEFDGSISFGQRVGTSRISQARTTICPQTRRVFTRKFILTAFINQTKAQPEVCGMTNRLLFNVSSLLIPDQHIHYWDPCTKYSNDV